MDLKNSINIGLLQCFVLVGPFAVSFFAGAVAAVVTFADDFTDKPKILFKSGWCWAYALFNGGMAVLIFSILKRIDVQILSLSFKDAQFLLAAIVGISWFKFLTSTWYNNESSSLSSQSLTWFFFKTKKYLYHHYSMNQMTILRPKVWNIVNDIDDSSFYDFSVRCIQLAKGISAEKGASLGESYSQYKETNFDVQDYKCAVAIDIAKIIGVDLLDQVAKEVKRQPSVSQDILQLESKLRKLNTNSPARSQL